MEDLQIFTELQHFMQVGNGGYIKIMLYSH